MTIKEEEMERTKDNGIYEYAVHLLGKPDDDDDLRRSGVVCAYSVVDAFNELMLFYNHKIGCIEYLDPIDERVVEDV